MFKLNSNIPALVASMPPAEALAAALAALQENAAGVSTALWLTAEAAAALALPQEHNPDRLRAALDVGFPLTSEQIVCPDPASCQEEGARSSVCRSGPTLGVWASCFSFGIRPRRSTPPD